MDMPIGDGYLGAIWTTSNKIDLTNYSTLNIQYGNMSLWATYQGYSIDCALSRNGVDYFYGGDKGGSLGRYSVFYPYSNISYANSVFTIDVSSINEPVYIAPVMLVKAYPISNINYYGGEVYKVWLE